MNENQIKTYVVAAAFVVGTGLAIKSCLQVREDERRKRQEIVANAALDLQAIFDATEIMNQRIDRGEIRTLDDLKTGLHTEIEFQKIAIREAD